MLRRIPVIAHISMKVALYKIVEGQVTEASTS